MTGPALALVVLAAFVGIVLVLAWCEYRDERSVTDVADELTGRRP